MKNVRNFRKSKNFNPKICQILNIDVMAKVSKPVQKYSLKKKVLNFSVAGKMLLISGPMNPVTLHTVKQHKMVTSLNKMNPNETNFFLTLVEYFTNC